MHVDSTKINSSKLSATSDNLEIYKKIQYRLLPLLFAGLICAYIDRVNISFAQFKMAEDLVFSKSIYGLGAGIFFIGYVIFEVPSNIILHKVGAKIWICRIMVSWGIVSGSMAFVNSPNQFYVLRFLLGVAEAGFFPGVILYLTYWFPANKLRNITALFIIAIPVANLIGGLLSGVILDLFSSNQIIKSWQWLFLIEAIPSIAVGIAIYKYIPNRIEDAKWICEADKIKLISEIRGNAKTSNNLPKVTVLCDKRVWAMIAIGACFSIGMYGVIFWMPVIIREGGTLDSSTIAFMSSIPWVFSIIGMIFINKFSTNFHKNKYHVVIPGLLGFCGLFLSVLFMKSTILSLLFLSLATTGIMCVFPGFWGMTSFLTGRSAAIGIAMINSISNVAGFVSPFAAGNIIDITGSISLAVLLMASFVLAGCLVAQFYEIERQ